MFNPRRSGECVLIDEAHLLADPDRGWAWTRALMEAEAPEIHVIGAPIARNLVERLAKAAVVDMDVVEHERLTPLRVAAEHWLVEELAPRTILVAFSRAAVLALKVFLEQRRRTVSVVYGICRPSAPPTADRFASGETEICVATDAVGMGLNLPADRLCFAELQKFDGREQRLLTPNEVRQIGGRAGRYRLSDYGEVGATTPQDLILVRDLFEQPPQDLTHARVAPTVEDIAMIPGTLAQRLEKWAALGSIPESLRGAIETADMTERIELASLLEPSEVQALGLAAAMRLINAPTQQPTRIYWRECASAIIYGQAMPMPPVPPHHIGNHEDLEWAEMCIRSADIYLWLASRHEFGEYGPDGSEVRIARAEWSKRIDEALVRKVDAAPRCAICGRRLPYTHRFRICDDCFRVGRGGYRMEPYPKDDYDYDAAPFKGRSGRRRGGAAGEPCPVCEANIEANPAARLAHWKREHANKTELTAMRAAWLLGVSKGELRAKVPFDYRADEANMRMWKLSTVEAAIGRQDAKGTA
jgi:ATP-dependent RNA helicase SUPV3L1/SUV3